MNELGCLLVGLLAGGMFGWWAHTAVWAIRDARTLQRWDAEAPELRPYADTNSLPNVQREPIPWRTLVLSHLEDRDE